MKIEQELHITHFWNEIQKAEINLLFTASWLKSRINRRLKEYELTHEQFNVLRIVRGHRQGGAAMCVKDVSERMIDRNSNTTRILDKLEAKQLIRRERSPDDGRETVVLLTDTAIDLLRRIDKDLADDNMQFTCLSDSEACLLTALLDKMRDSI